MGKMRKYNGRYAGQFLPRRIFAMLAAVIVMGLGVSLYVLGGMGADPFSTLNLGVSSKLGLSFGTWQILFNGAMLAAVFFIDRSMLGLGTLGNMFLIGITADFVNAWLAEAAPPHRRAGHTRAPAVDPLRGGLPNPGLFFLRDRQPGHGPL